MRPIPFVLALFGLTVSWSCRPHEHGDGEGEEHGHGHGASDPEGAPSRVVTHWTAETELFVEFPALTVESESPFAAHLTRLSDYKPIDAGTVSVILTGAGAPEERFEVSKPQVPGIFRPVARPQHAGKRRLAVRLESDGHSVTHELGEIEVFASLEAARKAGAQDEEPGLISFLKEQQWRIEFGTAPAAERTLRPSIPAHGELRATPGGEVRITAPSAGRLLTAGGKFPRIGMKVTANQLLASLAPQLGEGVDLATLELAVAEARLDVTHAERERQRVEGLHSDGAVPERRVVDARHQEAGARARLQAAERRFSHFRRLQRPAGSNARGIEIRSPIEGVLAAVDVAPGAFVEANRQMFHVVDLDRLWLEVRVPEANVGRLSDTAGVWFEAEGFDQIVEVNAGPVATGGVVDPLTRTVPFVFELENPEHRLRIGMSVRAHVLTGEPFTALAAPVTALVNDGGQDVIYVEVGGESFDRRVVELGARDGQLVQIKSGLRPGEHVVVKGAYAVKLASSSTQPAAHGHAH